MMHRAVKVTQGGHPHADIFNQPADAVKTNNIPYAVLICHNDKKSAYKIADQVLTAKTEGKPGNAGGGKKRCYGNARLLKNHEGRQNPNEYAECLGKKTDKCIFPFLFCFFGQKMVGDDNFSYGFLDENSREPAHKVGGKNNRKNFYAVAGKPKRYTLNERLRHHISIIFLKNLNVKLIFLQFVQVLIREAKSGLDNGKSKNKKGRHATAWRPLDLPQLTFSKKQ